MLVNPVISNVIQIIDVITNLYLDIERKVIWLRSSSSSSNLLLRPEAIPACITRPLSHCRKLISCQFAIFLPLKSLPCMAVFLSLSFCLLWSVCNYKNLSLLSFPFSSALRATQLGCGCSSTWGPSIYDVHTEGGGGQAQVDACGRGEGSIPMWTSCKEVGVFFTSLNKLESYSRISALGLVGHCTSHFKRAVCISCRPCVDVHKGGGGPTHVDACGQGARRGQKRDFFVDVINGWLLRHRFPVETFLTSASVL